VSRGGVRLGFVWRMSWSGLLLATSFAWGQASPGTQTAPAAPMVPPTTTPQAVQKPPQSNDEGLPAGRPELATTVWQWKGLHVDKIEFVGVTFDADDPLPKELAQKAGEPLDPTKVRASTRRLFASGRYRDIVVRGVRQGDGMTLIFDGVPRFFVGRVTIEGVRNDQMTSLLRYGTNLSPGAPLMQGLIPAGSEGIKQILEQQGHHEPTVSASTTTDKENHQINVAYTVDIGPQARVGQVTIVGNDPGLTVEEFRKIGRLREGTRVNRDTTSNALSRLRAWFQKRDRLAATVSLQKQTYAASRRQVDYEFQVNQGPEVKVSVEGADISKRQLHRLVPIYEEGTIDNDLLNEGVFNIRDYLQQQGYFNARVEVRVTGADTSTKQVVFSVDRSLRHKVMAVDIVGNKYFSDALLRERMGVKKADAYLRNGRFSPALVASDVAAIRALYRANGFDQAVVTTKVRDTDTGENGKPTKAAQIWVTFTIEEGTQQKFGEVSLQGVDPSRLAYVKGLLNTQSGQPFSLVTLSGDRDALLSYYLANGFDQVRVEITQQKESADAARTNVSLNVVEGPQVSISRVLLSGVERTRPSVVDRRILVHPGDPLDQTALLETQRNLYDLALFNEVITAVQNPNGDAPRKNVLVQVTEAKRWNVSYGFGFEAQTGTPSNNLINSSAESSSPEGKPGVSPRVSLDVSRINFRGTDNSLTLHSTYGLLQQVAILTFQNPRFMGSRNFSAALSGGYSNVQDITTFASSTLQGNFRVTQRWRRTDTFIYEFLYRRVRVDPNSLRVAADLIPLLSQPVRVGGPGVTWFHDTRQPSPLDAVQGSLSTIQTFIASSKFGSQTDFWRIDGTNSTYYRLGRYVLARNTRIGYERSWGGNPNMGTEPCLGDLLTTNPSCNAIPLPERLYAGGATSHRGFPINGAGPRDLQTGYPVGGSAAFVNMTELRMPAPTLPYVGDKVSFVLFHDMGNVFQNPSDMFPSFLRFRQPDRDTCRIVVGVTIGTCNFNYFSHAIGLGARYRTPVGPIRVDFSYNLNPPTYPVINDYSGKPPYVGEGRHFGFFFSIGQSF
jgi:outer membrane protein insertion porin family